MKFNIKSFLKKTENYQDNKLPFKININRIERYSFDQLVDFVIKYDHYTQSLRKENDNLKYDVDEILDAYYEVLEINNDLQDININLNNRIQENELKIHFKEFLPHTLQGVLQDCGFINNEFQKSYEKMNKQFNKCKISLELTSQRMKAVPDQQNEESLETTHTKSGQNLKVKQFEKIFVNALESFQNINKEIQQTFASLKNQQQDCLDNLSLLLHDFSNRYENTSTEKNFKNFTLIDIQQLKSIIEKSSLLEHSLNKQQSIIQQYEKKISRIEKKVEKFEKENKNLNENNHKLQEKYEKLQKLKNFCEEQESQNYDMNQALKDEVKTLKNKLLNLRSQMLIKENQLFDEKKKRKKNSFIQPKSARFNSNVLFQSTNFKSSQKQSNLSRLKEDITTNKQQKIFDSLLLAPENNYIEDITENSQESLLLNQPNSKQNQNKKEKICEKCQQQKQKIEYLQKEQLDLIQKLKVSNEKIEKQKFTTELFNQEESLLFNDNFEESKSFSDQKQKSSKVERLRLSTLPILITVTKTTKKQRNCLQQVEQGLKQIYKNYVLLISHPQKLQSQGIYLLEKQLNDLQELINLFLN